MREVDDEFVPPLSARTGTLALDVVAEPVNRESGLATYLQAMRDETWLLAYRDERLVGVLSYLGDHVDPAFRERTPSLYVTTIAVSPGCRGVGVGTALYDALDARAQRSGVGRVSTRTWSTNEEHVRLLRARGFSEVARLARKDTIDSVYFARPVPPAHPV